MGISATNARLLLDCRRNGMVFDRTLMLGRQNVYVSGPEYAALVRSLGMNGISRLAETVKESGEYAESFFGGLGAMQVDSIDASDFEGATLVHDLNQPVPSAWHERYDVVYDGGTLEHVFDFPRAIANCMRMTRVGGHLLLHTPANNMLGHGLYQFSPEVFFRLLGPVNGFEMKRLLAVEHGLWARGYEVVDPLKAGRRGELANRVPVWLHVEARKTAPTPEHLREIQQSDYQTRWDHVGEKAGEVVHLADPHHWVNPGVRKFLLTTFPRVTRFLERFTGLYLARGNSFRNSQTYRRVRW